jgi:hypothetical protein
MHGEERVMAKTARDGSFITVGLEKVAQKSYALNEIKEQLRNHAISMFGMEFVEERCPEPPSSMKNNAGEEPSVLEAIAIVNDRFDKTINELHVLVELLRVNV